MDIKFIYCPELVESLVCIKQIEEWKSLEIVSMLPFLFLKISKSYDFYLKNLFSQFGYFYIIYLQNGRQMLIIYRTRP